MQLRKVLQMALRKLVHMTITGKVLHVLLNQKMPFF